jgi:hypothetical protein
MKRAHDRRLAYEKARGASLDDDLRQVAALGPVGALIAQDFADATSGVPLATLRVSRGHARKLGFVVGHMPTFDASVLNAFHQHLEGTAHSPTHKLGAYQYAAACASRLMAGGSIRAFRIPRRYHAGRVASVTPPPKRMIDGAVGLAGVTDGDLLEAVVEFAYAELDAWRRKRRLGEALADAARPAYEDVLTRIEASGKHAPLGVFMDASWIAGLRERHGAEMDAFGLPSDVGTLVAFAYCLLYTLDHHGGMVRTWDAVYRMMEDGPLPGQRRFAYARRRIGKLRAELLVSMVGPGLAEMSALSVLLAAAHVNSESVLQLRADCLKATANPDMFVLSWTKGRSGGAMPGLGFPGGEAPEEDAVAPQRILSAKGAGSRERSIPFAVRDYLRASARFRAALGLPDGDGGLPDFRAPLLLAQSIASKPGEELIHSRVTVKRHITAFGERFSKHMAEARPGFGRVTVALARVRVSAINHFHRSSGSLKATAFAAQHISPKTTAHYIRHRETLDANAEEIRRISTQFEAAVRSDTLVLVGEDSAPAGTVDVGHGMSCTDRLWGGMPGQKAGSPCEFFVGCLSCEKAVVVATPLNHARLAKYRDHLHASRDRRDENPERWDRWIAPRLTVLDAALRDFPAETAKTGMQLSQRLRIEFGAIW